MRRFMTAALCLCMVFTLVACNKSKDNSAKTDIVGEWMSPSVNAAATFLEDGTGYLEYNGKQNVTWSYDAGSGRYIISGAVNEKALVAKEYDMDFMSVMDIEFYRPDDYDKAYTLMIGKRMEDITIFTENMTEIELNKQYDLLNAVTIEFTEVTVQEDNKGLLVSYTLTNRRNMPVTEGLSSQSNGKGYFATETGAIDLSRTIQWAESIEADSSVSDITVLMYNENIVETINRHGLVIGVVAFEFSGQYYYFEISDWLK